VSAKVLKYMISTEEDVDRELAKFRKFVRRNDQPVAFIKRVDIQQSKIIIPVL
jgi:hypothetical protein